jgi:hypothetical protein
MTMGRGCGVGPPHEKIIAVIASRGDQREQACVAIQRNMVREAPTVQPLRTKVQHLRCSYGAGLPRTLGFASRLAMTKKLHEVALGCGAEARDAYLLPQSGFHLQKIFWIGDFKMARLTGPGMNKGNLKSM